MQPRDAAPAVGDHPGQARGPSVLILTDSHGTSYAGRSYATHLEGLLTRRPAPASVQRVSFSGIPLAKWQDQLSTILRDDYDVIIVQYGNADVHPRLKLRLREAIKRVTGVRLRDTWFQVPPRFGPKFVVKLPFQMIKRFLVAVLGPESYTTVEHLTAFFQDVRSRIPEGAELIIIPLFNVRPWLYGTSHNRAVALLNERLRQCFGSQVLMAPHPPMYVADGYHWTEAFHRSLAQALSDRIPIHVMTSANEPKRLS